MNLRIPHINKTVNVIIIPNTHFLDIYHPFFIDQFKSEIILILIKKLLHFIKIYDTMY